MSGALSLPGLDVAPRGRSAPDERVRQKELGQFFTPAWLAAEVARASPVGGRVVLEPSAGDGAIVEACLRAGARKVIAVELDPRMVAKLVARFVGQAVEVLEGDFLAVPLERFDAVEAIAGNPPYDKGTDSDHLARIADVIMRAEERYLADGDNADPVEASLLLRTVALHSGDRFARVWSRLDVRELLPCADRIPFVIDGDEGEAGKIDVSIFRLGARVAGERGLCRHIREPE